MLRVVLFTGGRGSNVLSRRLLAHPLVRLTLAVNGYDDGASTGEVRRFLGDALGPSDFRKNASRVAEALESCSQGLLRLLDARLPLDVTSAAAVSALESVVAGRPDAAVSVAPDELTDAERSGVACRLRAFMEELSGRGVGFRFADCSIGNLVFAGSYLRCGRRFNPAVDDYVSLVGLTPGVVENVTDGTNAHLVALERDGGILGTEEAIVTSTRANRIEELFLIDRPLSDDECHALAARGAAASRRYFEEHAPAIALNPRLAARLDEANVIVYAPGTQHSSLFPSYLTPGLADRVANNVTALKLLITNLQYDAEIPGASAVSLVDRALFYLTNKGRSPRAAPALITHYLLNDPGQSSADRPYVPLGQVDSIEDPRLVRIGYFEEGVSGRHDAAKVLEPLLSSWLDPRPRTRIGVLLHGGTANKLIQSLLELARAFRDGETFEVTVFAEPVAAADPELLAKLPFAVVVLPDEAAASAELQRRSRAGEFDYAGVFESSGMYRGDDLAALFAYVKTGRLDAVWGSRRLSVRDIEESYRFHYYRRSWLRGISRIGSHLLSLAWLVLFGRYVADTLSNVWLVRAEDAGALDVPLTHRQANQLILGRLLRRRADLLEVPVQFISLSPERVRRTSIGDGIRALATIVRQRLSGPPASSR